MLILSREVKEALLVGDMTLRLLAVDDAAGEAKFSFMSGSPVVHFHERDAPVDLKEMTPATEGEFVLKPGEKYLFGNNVAFMLVRMRSPVARVGVECPREMHIYREELRGS